MASATCAQFWQALVPIALVSSWLSPSAQRAGSKASGPANPPLSPANWTPLWVALPAGRSPISPWPILKPGAYAAMMVADANAADVMRLLAVGVSGTRPSSQVNRASPVWPGFWPFPAMKMHAVN